jgi:drug/metabolite transporter (DMT)-like permease
VIIRTRTARPRADGGGLALAALSAATFGTSGTFASSLIGAGWSAAGAVSARVAISAVLLTVPALLQLRGRWGLLRRGAGTMTAFGLIAVAGCQVCFFNAVQRLPVGVALLLEYLGVVLVVGWMWLRHGQRPGRLTALGAVTALAGLVLVLNLSGQTRLDPAGAMWGLLAAVGLAVFFVLSASPGRDELPPVVMAGGSMWVGGAALALAGLSGLVPVTATTRQVSFLHHRVSWLVPVLGLSLVAAVVPYVAGIGAARRLGAKLASFVGLTEVLFAILFAWLLLGQLPTAVQFAGGALILAGVTLVRAGELRSGGLHAGEPRSGGLRAAAPAAGDQASATPAASALSGTGPSTPAQAAGGQAAGGQAAGGQAGDSQPRSAAHP